MPKETNEVKSTYHLGLKKTPAPHSASMASNAVTADTALLQPIRNPDSPLSELEVTDYLERNPHVLVDALKAVVDKYDKLLPVARRIQDLVRLGVLAGLVPQQEVVQFLERLDEGKDEKGRLAKYSLHHFIVKSKDGNWSIRSKRVFFESGSTIAYLIGALALWIEKNPQFRRPLEFPEVLTNNLLSLTAFVGLIDCVEHLRGRLYPKYFGFLPFEDNDPSRNLDERKLKDVTDSESKIVHEIVDDIHTCSAVFVTCSNFSFLAGPVVGSRANALMKRSIHYGKQTAKKRPTYCLMFHFDKIIPIRFPQGEEEYHVFDKPKLSCRRVFAAPQGLQVPPMPERQRWLRDHAREMDERVDGPTWHQHLVMPDEVLMSCPAEELQERIRQRDSENHTEKPLDLAGPWVDDVSGETHILVALPRNGVNPAPNGFKQAYETLVREVETATEIIRSSRHSKGTVSKYTIVTQPNQLEDTDGVVEIHVH